MTLRDNILLMYKMGSAYESTKNLEFRIIRSIEYETTSSEAFMRK